MQPILKFCARSGFSTAKLLAAIAISTIAGAGVSKAALENGTTFDLSVIGYNATGFGNLNVYDPTNDVYLAPTITSTFGGAPVTVAGVTVSSSETVVGQVITDTVTITDPTFFDAADIKPNGSPIIAMVFDLGEVVEGGTQNGLNYSSSINPAPAYFTTSGSMTYALGTVAGPTSTSFNGTDTSMYTAFAFQTLDPTSHVAQDMAPPEDVSAFSFTAVQVPEPVSAGVLGLLAGFGLLRRRRMV